MRNRPASALFLPTIQCLAAAALFGASTPLSKSLLVLRFPYSSLFAISCGIDPLKENR